MSQAIHPLAAKITTQVNDLRESGEFYDLVTPTTAELLKFWFDDEVDNRQINFHIGQKQAILNAIYCHEVLKSENVYDLYNKVDKSLDLESGVTEDIMNNKRYSFPRYCMKMATGTGKTWVLNALLLRQFLNAHEGNPGFTKNFMIVAPGLIVYDRLLDSLMGKEIIGGTARDFQTSDFYNFRELFIPEYYRDLVFGFVQNNTVEKENIGRRPMGDGQILLLNRHAITPKDENEEIEIDDIYENPQNIKNSILPLTPGISAGNSLEALDRKFSTGGDNYILEYCKNIKNMMVFNDEAHHLGEKIGKSEIDDDKKRQQAINIISQGKGLFVQVDFSATPFIESGKKDGNGKLIKKYFPHIITDFRLEDAMKKGLVKLLALDNRNTYNSIKDEDLDFNAERDEAGTVIGISKGQKTMIKAGLTKLMALEDNFKKFHKYPKMLIVCEDTNVVPFVAEHIKELGYDDGDYEEIHSNKKGEVTKDERQKIKQNVFGIDKLSKPKIIISVLMLREGFDVNNICVIVPLRSTTSGVLLEQTIGRGLRLMRRDFEDERFANIKKLSQGQEPETYYDILNIVEHPRFKEFYDDLKAEGLVIDDSSDLQTINNKALGDRIEINLKNNYQEYDLFWPIIISDIEEVLKSPNYTLDKLPSMSSEFDFWKNKTSEKERFHSTEILSKTRFGDYDVDVGAMHANSYNDYISKITNRISQYTNTNTIDINNRGFGDVGRSYFPSMTVDIRLIADILDKYLRYKLFNKTIDYNIDANWKVLTLEPVFEHIVKYMTYMIEAEKDNEGVGEPEVVKRYISEVKSINIRSNFAIDVKKTIYDKIQYPSNKGIFEKDFIEFVDSDSLVQAFCKIDQFKHTFINLRYNTESGARSNYYPDFIVKTNNKIYIVETKAQKDMKNENVIKKKKSAINYLNRINKLPLDLRDNREREYVLLSDNYFYINRDNGANIIEMLENTKINKEIDQVSLFG